MPKTNYNTITTVNSSAESKSIDGEQFDGTAKLAKEGAIILIPSPSQDPRGKQPVYQNLENHMLIRVVALQTL